MSQSKLQALAGSRLQKGVLVLGWLTVFVLITAYIIVPSIAIALYVGRTAASAPVAAPSVDFIGDDLLLLIVAGTLVAIVYALIQGVSLLSVATFGEKTIETGREEATESIETAQETADSAADTIDQHTD